MTLLRVLNERRGVARQLAEAAGLSRPYIWQCASGQRTIPPAACPPIERALSGEITVEQLRPDIRWHRVPDPAWPHPGGRPLIDVAAAAQSDEASCDAA
jgi:DNA-binding transcriptional regulator YdaS (Cro superfamily)